MKTNNLFLSRWLAGLTSLFVGTSLFAAPLSWFPGTALNEARSSAATVTTPGGSIMILGGNPGGSTNVLLYGGNNASLFPMRFYRVVSP